MKILRRNVTAVGMTFGVTFSLVSTPFSVVSADEKSDAEYFNLLYDLIKRLFEFDTKEEMLELIDNYEKLSVLKKDLEGLLYKRGSLVQWNNAHDFWLTTFGISYDDDKFNWDKVNSLVKKAEDFGNFYLPKDKEKLKTVKNVLLEKGLINPGFGNLLPSFLREKAYEVESFYEQKKDITYKEFFLKYFFENISFRNIFAKMWINKNLEDSKQRTEVQDISAILVSRTIQRYISTIFTGNSSAKVNNLLEERAYGDTPAMACLLSLIKVDESRNIFFPILIDNIVFVREYFKFLMEKYPSIQSVAKDISTNSFIIALADGDSQQESLIRVRPEKIFDLDRILSIICSVIESKTPHLDLIVKVAGEQKSSSKVS